MRNDQSRKFGQAMTPNMPWKYTAGNNKLNKSNIDIFLTEFLLANFHVREE